MKILIAMFAACCCLLATTLHAEDSKKELKVGDDAPDFKLMGSDGKHHTLSDFKGKSAVLIAWYPKALTGG